MLIFTTHQKQFVKRYGLSELEILLYHNEGLSLSQYKCTAGKNTIGIGHNLEDNPLPKNIQMVDYSISEIEAIELMRLDIARNHHILREGLKMYNQLDTYPKIAVQDLVFNMGFKAFTGFKNTIDLLGKKEYKKASQELLNSTYANQLPNRSSLVSKLMSNEYSLSELINYKG